MPYPLIIIGAGASHDYSDFSPTAPPITKDLVSGNYLNGDLLKKYPPVSDLLSEISCDVNTHGKSFEQALQEIKERSGNILKIQTQLIALEFYLQDLFQQISHNFQKINNYKILHQHITAYAEDKACIVSFNYDSLFEDSLTGKDWNKISDYINDSLKIIKLHGSHNWSYIQHEDAINFSDDYKSSYEFLSKNPTYLSSFKSKGINPYHNNELHGKGYFKFPAIATPLLSKEDTIICPKQHLETLQQELSKIDRILVIGWQAADNYLLTLIKKLVKPNVRFIVVTKQKESADKVSQKIASVTDLSGKGIPGGFKNFVGSDEYHNFLKN